MPQYVRVTDPVSGAEVTMTDERADALGLKPLAGRVAVDDYYGHPLPAKPRTDKAGEPAADKKASA